MHVSTYKSWDEMGRWYWGLVKDQFVARRRGPPRAAEALTAGLKDERAKVRAVYDYVVQKTRYVALEFGIHGLQAVPVRADFRARLRRLQRQGDAHRDDAAARSASRRRRSSCARAKRATSSQVPASLAPFDHMIAYVPSLDLYLDGTAEYTGSLELPAMDRGALALQVNEGDAKLVHLPDPPPSASVSARWSDAALAPDGAAQLDWRVDVSGVEASEWRVNFHAAATRKQRVEHVIASILPGSEVTTVDTGDLEDIEQKVTMHVRGRASRFARAEGDVLTVPLGRKEHMIRDYAPLAARKLDVRLPAQRTEEDDWVVRLPSGAKVKSIPAPARGSGPFGSYSVVVESNGNALHVKTTVTLARTRIMASEYPAFRAWCEEVDRGLGQRATVSVR